MYRHGVGVQKDLEKAKIYFEKIKDAEITMENCL